MFGDRIVHPSYALSKLIIKKGISSKIRTNKYDLNSYFMAIGRDQLRYHGKHHYLSTAELHARHNYYKILFFHINYPLNVQHLQLQTNKDNNSAKPFQNIRQMLRISKQDPMNRSLQANF